MALPTLNLIGCITGERFWFLPFMCMNVIAMPFEILFVLHVPLIFPILIVQLLLLDVYWRCYSYLALANSDSVPMGDILMVEQRTHVMMQETQRDEPPPAYWTVTKYVDNIMV